MKYHFIALISLFSSARVCTINKRHNQKNPTLLQELYFVTFVSEALTQEQLKLPQVIVEVLFHVFEPKKLKVLRVFVPIRPVVLNKASIH